MKTLLSKPEEEVPGPPVNDASLLEECTCGDHDPCEALKKGDLCESAKITIIGYVPKGWRSYNPDFTERLN